MHEVSDTHDTDRRTGESSMATAGISDHLDPSQRSASGLVAYPPWRAEPTAMQEVGELQDTADSSAPERESVAVTVHCRPFQASASVRYVVGVTYSPTAMHQLADGQETALSCPFGRPSAVVVLRQHGWTTAHSRPSADGDARGLTSADPGAPTAIVTFRQKAAATVPAITT